MQRSTTEHLRITDCGTEYIAERTDITYGGASIRIPMPDWMAAWVHGPRTNLMDLPADQRQIVREHIDNDLWEAEYATH